MEVGFGSRVPVSGATSVQEKRVCGQGVVPSGRQSHGRAEPRECKVFTYQDLFSFSFFLVVEKKHMLSFVALIHALPPRERKVPNSCFQGEFCIKGRKKGRNTFV
jgi:hypothetical protein